MDKPENSDYINQTFFSVLVSHRILYKSIVLKEIIQQLLNATVEIGLSLNSYLLVSKIHFYQRIIKIKFVAWKLGIPKNVALKTR